LAGRSETAPAAAIRAAIEALWPGRFEQSDLTDDVRLGTGGLELDSIEIVELVLECEERAGRTDQSAADLLDGRPVTIGRVIDHLRAR
jgi:acyl carrier protein